MIPFSIFWCGFAIFWMVGASGALWASEGETTPINYIFPLFGLPFVLVGLYMVFGRFLVDKAQREKTTYGVSSERVIIKSGLFSSTVKSLNLRTLSDITLKERKDGSGTITFGASHPMFAMFEGMNWWPGTNQYQSPSFDSIREAKKVYDTIRQQLK
ncbi:MAG: PH domain-containing protein [Bdellovibrionales bacterium]|nr:PH domain-containing protein [Bdellovibrionales bacterium]